MLVRNAKSPVTIRCGSNASVRWLYFAEYLKLTVPSSIGATRTYRRTTSISGRSASWTSSFVSPSYETFTTFICCGALATAFVSVEIATDAPSGNMPLPRAKPFGGVAPTGNTSTSPGFSVSSTARSFTAMICDGETPYMMAMETMSSPSLTRYVSSPANLCFLEVFRAAFSLPIPLDTFRVLFSQPMELFRAVFSSHGDRIDTLFARSYARTAWYIQPMPAMHPMATTTFAARIDIKVFRLIVIVVFSAWCLLSSTPYSGHQAESYAKTIKIFSPPTSCPSPPAQIWRAAVSAAREGRTPAPSA